MSLSMRQKMIRQSDKINAAVLVTRAVDLHCSVS